MPSSVSKPTISLRAVRRVSFTAPLGVRLWASSQLPTAEESRWVMELSSEGKDESEARFMLRALALAIIDSLGEIEDER